MTMDCGRALEAMQDDLDGRLSAAAAAELQQHVASCATCAAGSRSLRELRGLFLSMPPEPAPEGFREEVMARLPAGRRLQLPFWIAAAAAALLVAVTTTWRPHGTDGPSLDVAGGNTAESEESGDAIDRSSESLDLLDGKAAARPRGMRRKNEGSGTEREALFEDGEDVETLERERESQDLGGRTPSRDEGAGRDPAEAPGAPRPEDIAKESPAPAPEPSGVGAGPPADALDRDEVKGLADDTRRGPPRPRQVVVFEDATAARAFLGILRSRAAADGGEGGGAGPRMRAPGSPSREDREGPDEAAPSGPRVGSTAGGVAGEGAGDGAGDGARVADEEAKVWTARSGLPPGAELVGSVAYAGSDEALTALLRRAGGRLAPASPSTARRKGADLVEELPSGGDEADGDEAAAKRADPAPGPGGAKSSAGKSGAGKSRAGSGGLRQEEDPDAGDAGDAGEHREGEKKAKDADKPGLVPGRSGDAPAADAPAADRRSDAGDRLQVGTTIVVIVVPPPPPPAKPAPGGK